MHSLLPVQPTRRQILAGAVTTAAALALGRYAPGAATTTTAPVLKKLLYFTKSSVFQHSVITRKGEELAYSEKLLIALGRKNGYEITASKDGTIFNDDRLHAYDGLVFFTTGDLTVAGADKQPPMSADGKAALLKAIEGGMGFLGLHCATDTFHSKRHDELLRPENEKDPVDPYIAMLGGEFTGHGSQQKATIRLIDDKFPGFAGLKDYQMLEEWYAVKNLAPDMRVLLVQDTTSMIATKSGERESQYRRGPDPQTWARTHGKGRVFYTSMGHREDVWKSPVFTQVLLSGLAFVTGNAQVDLTPNIKQACPDLAAQLGAK